MDDRPPAPVLFLVFNRPDLTRRVFDRIREARPARLFIAADGPRAAHPGDAEACRLTRRVAEQVDWPCEVKTLFREANLGCRQAVESAITWFLEHVEAGIILEDDCLPDPTFFPYCTELLERYREDERVTTISGMGYSRPELCGGESYSFSIYQLIWGWATWRRAWRRYCPEPSGWPCLGEETWRRTFFGRASVARAWERVAEQYRAGRVDTWDYPWNFSCWAFGGLAAVPSVNLVENIGFGPEGTHTRGGTSKLPPAGRMSFPLRHPGRVVRSEGLDREYEQRYLALPQTHPVSGGAAALRRRWKTVRQLMKTLVPAWRTRQSFVQARRLDLPGREFYRLGRQIGWRLLRRDVRAARDLLACPVHITRYFEFDFAWRALTGSGFEWRQGLDVSSPFLFSFRAARDVPTARVKMLNPDSRDIRRSQRLAQMLNWPGLKMVAAGVESLEGMPEHYDAVWSLSVIEHIAGEGGDDRDAVRRMWTVLRPGGRLILTVPTDRRAWDEHRGRDPYGTQPEAGRDGYFFQRFYDEAAIRERIADVIGREPAMLEWFGEKEAGHFHAYIARWRKEGEAATYDDPRDLAANYRRYPSFAQMPGAGVCGLMFIKPEDGESPGGKAGDGA